ncbi:MAG: LPP20 family lipoprotein [Sulfurimonas sp.]|nr:LPP20 family lipoprotein [Sulfurimonas sp.]
MINVRKVFNIAVLGVLLALFGGCASTGSINPQVKSECMQEGVSAPSWVCKPQVMNGYASLGIAENYKTDSALAVKEALKNGRKEIAKQIQSQVKDKINNFSRITAISSKEKVDNLYESIAEEVKPMNITLEKELKSWVSPSSKLYVHVIAPKSTSDEEIKTAVKTSYLSDRVTWLSFKSKEALNNLEKEFGVTMPIQQQVNVAEIFRTEKVLKSSVGRNRKN